MTSCSSCSGRHPAQQITVLLQLLSPACLLIAARISSSSRRTTLSAVSSGLGPGAGHAGSCSQPYHKLHMCLDQRDMHGRLLL